MAWSQDVYVTASNPSPGREVLIDQGYMGYARQSATFRSDQGLGINVYVAGGSGTSGTMPASVYDEKGQAVILNRDGMTALPVSDENVENILGHILTELRLIRMHIEIMTGEEIMREDIE